MRRQRKGFLAELESQTLKHQQCHKQAPQCLLSPHSPSSGSCVGSLRKLFLNQGGFWKPWPAHWTGPSMVRAKPSELVPRPVLWGSALEVPGAVLACGTLGCVIQAPDSGPADCTAFRPDQTTRNHLQRTAAPFWAQFTKNKIEVQRGGVACPGFQR